jgi:transcriptional antiterminator NusG
VGGSQARRWPTRKETLQTTVVVFAFVFIMALFLWSVDASLLWITQSSSGREADMTGMRWYVVHAYSGQEKSIQNALLDRIKRSGMQDKFGQVLVPTEEVVEMKGGQKAISESRFFPGYILVQMEMTDETWHLVKSTPKVTGFIGGSAMRPTPISEKEVQNIMHQVQEGVEKPKPKVLFEVGESVRVTEGLSPTSTGRWRK